MTFNSKLVRFAIAGCLLAPDHSILSSEWEAGQGFRSAPLPVPLSGKPGFAQLPPATTGIFFTNDLAAGRSLTNQIYLNGSGVAAGDVDSDGLVDLYFCRLDGPNVLYRNLGNWKFEDITATAGVACPNLAATGAALADIDGDGDLDLIVNSIGGGTHVFFNDGKGHFTESAQVLNAGKGGMSLALADVDGDGFLDLYIANYRTSALMDMPNARATFKKVDGKVVVDRVDGRSTTEPDLTNRFVVNAQGGVGELGEPDLFCRNQGGTNFVPVSFTDGSFLDEEGRSLTDPPFDWGLSVMFRDLNGDGLPDIYVCNDFQSPDRIWINQGLGKFRAVPGLALRKTSRYSMGIDFADINRDGFDDFIVLDMLSREHRQRMSQVQDSLPPAQSVGDPANRPQYGLNTLFLNRGDGTYAEIAQFSGLDATEWSWCPIFLDVDLDGYEDLLVSNGQEHAARDLDVIEHLRLLRAQKKMSDAEIFQARKMFPRLATANLAFRNQRDLTFKETGRDWGFAFQGISHGMCLCDLDGDGDLDVVVNNLNDAAGVYRNESSAPRVAVRLKGLLPNTRAIGARIWVWGGAVAMQSQEMICGGRYLSSDDPIRVFAAGSLTNEMRIEVKWRSGRRSVVNGVKANRVYEVDEAGAEASSKSKPQSPREQPTSNIQQSINPLIQQSNNPPPPVFEDVSQLIQHTHHEEGFNDFEREPLLPRKLTQLGPGVAWYDLDGDGKEDLIVGSGKGGPLAVYRNDGRGGFQRLTGAPLTQIATRDQTTVLGWSKAPGHTVILTGSANYADGLAVGACVRQYDLAGKTVDDTLPGRASSTGPLTLGDVDGAGHLSLFVGGRVIPGRWPEAASSMLFRETNGKWEPDPENSKRLENVGLVSGAVFSDLDGDGLPELILACEWGPVRVFHNDRGKLVSWDVPLTINDQRSTLNQLTGWWNGVTTGDLDGDGRLDIIASNWGRNTRYESHRMRPLQIYYGDFNGDGTLDVVEAYYDGDLKKVVPEQGLDFLAIGMPFLREQFATHAAYAGAGVAEMLGGRLKGTRQLEATTLESMVFLNRGDHFEARPLPAQAQFAPAYAVCVGDFDGDGNEDVFLSQNFFGMNPDSSRCDAGRGLWLRGDSTGNFTAVPGQVTGVKIYGQQRGAALCDYDGDGRLDLVVAQNGAETKLYHNVGARPGLRVRLKGPAGNPQAVGARLRLFLGERAGPAREIHAGSGYWSQDSAIQVLGTPEPPTSIQVRWPGGKVTTSALPKDAKEVLLDENGGAEQVK